jgi:hypothetical protein
MTILDTPVTTTDALGIEQSTHESDSTIQLHGTVVFTHNRNRAYERYSFYLDPDTKGSHTFEIMFVKDNDEELFERGKAVPKSSIVTAGVGVILMAGGARMYRARELTLEE